MKDIEIACPADAWPVSLSGNIALGVTSVRSGEIALWLVFQVNRGAVERVRGMLSQGNSNPPEVTQLQPVILASATKDTWLLITSDKKAFYKQVAKGELHIEGDFREFGRLASRLIRLTEQGRLWTRIDEIADAVS